MKIKIREEKFRSSAGMPGSDRFGVYGERKTAGLVCEVLWPDMRALDNKVPVDELPFGQNSSAEEALDIYLQVALDRCAAKQVEEVPLEWGWGDEARAAYTANVVQAFAATHTVNDVKRLAPGACERLLEQLQKALDLWQGKGEGFEEAAERWLTQARNSVMRELGYGAKQPKGSLADMFNKAIEVKLQEDQEEYAGSILAEVAARQTPESLKKFLPKKYAGILKELSGLQAEYQHKQALKDPVVKPGTYKVHGVYKNDSGYFNKRKSKNFDVRASSATELLRSILVKLDDDAEDLQEFDSRYASKIKTKQDIIEFLGIREEGGGYQVVDLVGPDFEYKSPNYYSSGW